MNLNSFETEFNAWKERVHPDILNALNTLSESLSDEPEELIRDLVKSEAWNGRLQSLLSEANTFLDKGAIFYMPEKGSGFTQLQMKIVLDKELALIRGMRNKIEGICDAIKQRLILGESILRYFSMTKDFSIKQFERPF